MFRCIKDEKRARDNSFFQKGRLILSHLLVVVLLTACGATSPQRPQAASEPIKKGKISRYPSSRYIVGEGCVPLSNDVSADKDQADMAARAEIAKQIEVRVVQVIDAIQKEILACG